MFADITLTGAKTDLDEAMATLGYTYESTDPATTTGGQASTEMGSIFEPRRVLWEDHFVTGNPGSSDSFGMMGWRCTPTGTGANVTIIDGTAGRPGIAQIEGGTSAAARSSIYLGNSTLANNLFVASATQNQIDFAWVVKPFQSIAVTDLERLQVGVGSEWSVDAELANGVYWRYTTGIDSSWTLVAANGGTRTVSASGTAPVVGTWVKLAVRMTYPGGVATARGYINDVAVGSAITTNIPAAAVSPGAMIQGVGAVITEAMLHIDETYGYQDPL